MTDGDDDPVVLVRNALQQLFLLVRRPTYRTLTGHADRLGLTLRSSTVGDLLNGPGTPRWDTVEAFVRACARHARAQGIETPTGSFDIDGWYARYRSMQDASLTDVAPRARTGRRHGPPVPAQLPADVRTFTGRAREMAELDRLLAAVGLDAGSATPTVVGISAIDGTAGIGKTCLAVHWAHRIADRFPDGQLYINLRGFDPGGATLDPGDAVRGFLDALQVNAERVPATLHAQTALYRSLLTGRRMLIVLDNARDSDQVRHLLPGTPGCLVIVTSRSSLIGLEATHGAHRLTLDLLDTDESRDLLTQRLGAARATAEPEAVDLLVTACARLPVALAIAAARAQQTRFPLATLTDELHDAARRLDALDTGDPVSQVRAVFSWSYHTLTDHAARLFRLLGRHPGPDVGVPAAASLTGQPVPATRRLLDELTRASLLIEHAPGRYTFHDLLRVYATEQANAVDTEPERRAATTRTLDHYLHTAFAAERLLHPTRQPITLAAADPQVTTHHLSDDRQASDWFTAERLVLLAAVDHAAAAGFDTHAWQLVWSLQSFNYRRGLWHDSVTAGRVAVAAATRTGDPDGQLRTHRLLADAYTRLKRFDEADGELRRALDVGVRHGDTLGQGHVHLSLAMLWDERGEPRSSLDHARRALELLQDKGHRGGTAYALTAVGWGHAQLGEHEPALTALRPALVLHREGGNSYGEAWTWGSMGHAHRHRPDSHAESITCYRRAITLYRDAGDRYEEAKMLTRLGDVHDDAGDRSAARDSWQRALTLLDDLHHLDAEGVRDRLGLADRPPG